MSGGINVRRYGSLLSPGSIVGVELEGNALHLRNKAGETLKGYWAGTTFVSRHFAVIGLTRPGSLWVTHAVLTVNNVPPEDFRKLRVALRWGNPATGQGGKDTKEPS